MDFVFSCPVCGSFLSKDEKILKCQNGHCFDIAKQGYVNLLQSQKSSSKRHGDDKAMVIARYDFLNKGYYSSLAEMITDKIGSITFDGMKFADLGCGECYYTAAIEKLYPNICIGGIDISKQSLIIGSRRKINASLAVASTFALPISDNYCDAVMSVFAPYSLDEVNRVLKNGGYFLRVYPLERHLMGLKSLIYDKPYLNDVDLSIPSGFELSERSIIKDKIKIENNSDIINLFMMTPYFYKTSRKDQEKIMAENKLETEIEFGIDILIKK